MYNKTRNQDTTRTTSDIAYKKLTPGVEKRCSLSSYPRLWPHKLWFKVAAYDQN